MSISRNPNCRSIAQGHSIIDYRLGSPLILSLSKDERTVSREPFWQQQMPFARIIEWACASPAGLFNANAVLYPCPSFTQTFSLCYGRCHDEV